MLTFTAITQCDNKAKADHLAEALECLTPEPTGVGVLEIEDGSGLFEVASYFTESPDIAGLALLAAIDGVRPFVISELPETDWVAKVQRELSPVVAGRFVVYGSHDADKVPAGKTGLLIEASMAFGTGHHGTTLGCLNALDRLERSGFVARNVVDVGCGTAVLAMAAAHLFPNPVLASDMDEVAVEVAAANVVANGLTDRVTCLLAEGLDHPTLTKAAPFDLIVANILKGPLIALSPDFAAATCPGGHLILSGLLNEQAEDILNVYSQNGYNLVENQKIGDWTTLTLCQRSA